MSMNQMMEELKKKKYSELIDLMGKLKIEEEEGDNVQDKDSIITIFERLFKNEFNFEQNLEHFTSRTESLRNIERSTTNIVKSLDSIYRYPEFEGTHIESFCSLTQEHIDLKKKLLPNEGTRILISGDNSCGKSSIINLFCKEKLLPEKDAPCTATICEMVNSNRKELIVFTSSTPNTLPLKDNAYEVINQHFNSLNRYADTVAIDKMVIFYPLPVIPAPTTESSVWVSIVDSPGLGEQAVFDRVVHDYFESCGCFVFVIDSSRSLTSTVKTQMRKVLRIFEGKILPKSQLYTRILFLCNKIDIVDTKEKEETKKNTIKGIKDIFPEVPEDRIVFISCKYSYEHINRLKFYNQDFKILQQAFQKMIFSTLRSSLEDYLRFCLSNLRESKIVLRAQVTNSIENANELERNIKECMESLEALRREDQFEKIITELDTKHQRICQDFIRQNQDKITEQTIRDFVNLDLDDVSDISVLESTLKKVFQQVLENHIAIFENDGYFQSLKNETIKKLEDVYGSVVQKLEKVESRLFEVPKERKRTNTLNLVNTIFQTFRQPNNRTDYVSRYPREWRKEHALRNCPKYLTLENVREIVGRMYVSPSAYGESLKKSKDMLITELQKTLRKMKSDLRVVNPRKTDLKTLNTEIDKAESSLQNLLKDLQNLELFV